jgi:hypothetical protein
MPQPTNRPSSTSSPSAISSPSASSSPKGAQQFTTQTWDKVNTPGAYVCNETGRLLRVPTSALDAHKKPMIDLAGPHGSPKVTRLSADSKSPIADLRTACSSTEIKAQF